MSDFVIIGAGPAGISAANESARYGVKVTLIDENNLPGGQLFTQTHKFFGSREHRAGVRGFQIGYDLIEEIKKLNVDILLNTIVYGISADMEVEYITEGNSAKSITAGNILISTGALEKPIVFKGWTKPGVMGAGAAQTMMNVHRVLPGRKVLMVGSGNVGLIVAYQLKQAGADVVGIIEAMPGIGGYKVHASKVRRIGIPILTSYTIKEAKGSPQVSSAVIVGVGENLREISGTEDEIKCDLICIAAGLKPFDELCWLLNLEFKYIDELGGFVPVHNDNLETSMENIYVAGDTAGVEEASTAMEEGRLVGVAVAQKLGYLSDRQAEKLKGKIKDRLKYLRLGSFGKKRAEGKKKLISISK